MSSLKEEKPFLIDKDQIEGRLFANPNHDFDSRPITQGKKPIEPGDAAQVNVWYPGSYSPDDLVFVDQAVVPLIEDFKQLLARKETAIHQLNTSDVVATLSQEEVAMRLKQIQADLARESGADLLPLEVFPGKMEMKPPLELIQSKLYELIEVLDAPQPKNELVSWGNESVKTPWRASFYWTLITLVSFAINGDYIHDQYLLSLLHRTRLIWDQQLLEASEQKDGGGDDVNHENLREIRKKRRFTDPHERDLAKYVLWAVYTSLVESTTVLTAIPTD